MKILVSVHKTVTEDSYTEGEIGKTADHGEIDSRRFNSLDEAREFAHEYMRNTEPMIFEDRVLLQTLEDAEGDIISQNSVRFEQWTAGELKAYAVTYDMYMSVVLPMDNDTLRHNFKNFPQA